MERRVREHGVEFVHELEPFGVHHSRVEAGRARCLDLQRAAVDADDLATEIDELSRERAVAATEIEDALARARREQLDDGSAEVGYEPGVSRVPVGIPGLRLRHRTLRAAHALRAGFTAITANTRCGIDSTGSGKFSARSLQSARSNRQTSDGGRLAPTPALARMRPRQAIGV